MSAGTSLKPQWLIAFQAYLRAHPVRRAAYWAIACFVLFQALHLLWGDVITARSAIVELLLWALAGVAFYACMRRWEANHAG